MMVSKVAVVALVAIIAVPILMGYAFNINEVQETDWKLSGEAVNVTSLLRNDAEYSTAHGDTYQLNTDTYMGGIKSLPLYENKIRTSTSLYSRIFGNSVVIGGYDLAVYDNFGFNVFNSTDSQYLRMKIYYIDESNNLIHYRNIDNAINASYDGLSKTLNYSYILSSGGYSSVHTGTYSNDRIYLDFEHINGFNANDNSVTWGSPQDHTVGNPGYVDFSAGFRVLGHNQTVNQPYVWSEYPAGGIKFPQNTKTAILTMDLDSITDANYSMLVGDPWFYLNKTTTAGVVSWQIVDYYDPSNVIDLYYNQSGENTYQLYFYVDPNGEPTGTPGYYEYTRHIQFRYVGNWPDLIGEADYYLTFDYSMQTVQGKYPGFGGIAFESYTSPIMRVDAAEYLAFEHSVIRDQTYDPAAFKTNPSTKISGVSSFGYSLEFGGNSYVISKQGTISLNGHDIPVSGLTLSSVPNDNNGYDNKIGNTVISSTASPSTVKFVGAWDVVVTTQSLESYTITKTEWKAGEFAWNGIDHNFLLCGLITCLGVFIGCGIYARKNGTGGLLPLMIATGCAAAVFFLML